MFQIEPILWLQSLESAGLTWLMSTITLLGYTPVYALLIISVTFGVRLRQGIFVLLAMLIAGIMTDGLKRGLKFPRPSDIDIRVIEPGKGRPPLLVDGGGAKTFWTLPSSGAMAAAKLQPDWSYGFPSGHVGAAAACFLGLAFFFRSKGLFVFSVSWILLMALSRMYLGRHFIADVLAGMGVGALAVVVAALLVLSLNSKDSRRPNAQALLPWASFVVPLVCLAPFVELLDVENIGRLLGLLVSYASILKIGLPSDVGEIWRRIARVSIAFILFIAMDRAINLAMDSTSVEDNRFAILAATFLINCVPFIGTVAISRRLRLYSTS